jgi:hypothetical protein
MVFKRGLNGDNGVNMHAKRGIHPIIASDYYYIVIYISKIAEFLALRHET